VKPNAGESSLKEQQDGTWIAKVKALPVDGKANKELVALVASHFWFGQAPGLVKKRRLRPLKNR